MLFVITMLELQKNNVTKGEGCIENPKKRFTLLYIRSQLYFVLPKSETVKTTVSNVISLPHRISEITLISLGKFTHSKHFRKSIIKSNYFLVILLQFLIDEIFYYILFIVIILLNFDNNYYESLFSKIHKKLGK